MGINEESEYETFEVELKEDGRFHLNIKEEELVDKMKELMTPFLIAHVHDLILDITENIPSIDSPEDMEDYKDAGGTGIRKFDMIVSYVTYNDGHFVDPNVHGGAIRLSVEDCNDDDDEPTIIDGKESDFTRSELNRLQREESKLRKNIMKKVMI